MKEHVASDHHKKSHIAGQGSKQVNVTHELKQRRIGRILELVQTKLLNFLVGRWSRNQLLQAMKDAKIKRIVQKHMANENIQLKHKENPVYRK